MRLEIRLTLASLVMIILFLLTFAGTFTLLGGRELLRPPGGSWAQRVREMTQHAYGEGGWPAVQAALHWAYLPPAASINLYGPGDEQQVLQGQARRFEPETAAMANQLGSYERATWGGPELWVAVGEGPLVGYVRLNFHANDGQQGRFLLLLLLLSALVASLTAFLAGLVGSRAIARPVKSLVVATQALAQSDFRHRISASGPGEFVQLAESFNAMADNLERTIVSLREAKDRADLAKEKAERSEASRRQFLADVSHNLRTPLAAILGWSEALLDGLTPGEETLHLRNIRQETYYVSQNVQRLLDWSRWEEAPPQLLMETFPVSEPLMDCVQTLEELAQSRSVNLKLSGLEDEPQVRGDRHKVRELFQLLLENAVQHNQPGTEIEVTFAACPDRRIQVTVGDNGQGLPEELRENLESRAGGGLGLAIACRLARAHGDELRLLAPELEGTRLRFTLEEAEH